MVTTGQASMGAAQAVHFAGYVLPDEGAEAAHLNIK